MKRLPIITAALGLALVAPLAMAQPDNGQPDQQKMQRRNQPDRAADRQAPPSTAPDGTRNRTTNTQRNVNVRRTVDVTRFRRAAQAPRRYRIARPWIAPRGYVYRRFALGERIPGVLLAAGFFLGDFGIYGLEAPPYGYVWVRDGSDAVLVDRYTGEVIQVQYGLFY